MSTENIIQEVLSDNLSSAKKQTEELLYSKLNDAINAMKEDVVGSTYEDAIGIATLAEKRKAKKNGDDENGDEEQKYAKKTDKEDDGEGLDPVDAEDSDVDNDGDSDSSDDYLKNRRKTVKKAVKKDDEEEDEDDKNEGYNVSAKHDDHIKASAAIGSGTHRRGPLAGGQSVGNKKYNLRFDDKKTGKKFMQKHGFKEDVEEDYKDPNWASKYKGNEVARKAKMRKVVRDHGKAFPELKKKVKEDTDLQELSRGTLANYTKKASADVRRTEYQKGRQGERYATAKDSDTRRDAVKQYNKLGPRTTKRMKGISKALGRLGEGKGDGRASHIFGMEKEKYMKLSDSQKDKIRTKYHKEKEQAEKEKGHS